MAGPSCDAEKPPEASDVEEMSARDPWMDRSEGGALGSAHGWVGEEELVVDFGGFWCSDSEGVGSASLPPSITFLICICKSPL